MKKVNTFAQDLKEAKTPRQTYVVLQKHSDKTLSQLGMVYLVCKYKGYVESVGSVLKADKFHQKRNRNNYTSNAISKNNARKIFRFINQYTNKAVGAL